MPEPALRASPLPPRSTIGILGSGQLGKMLAQAASRLGFRTHVYADDSGPAFDVAAAHSVGGYRNLARLDEFARAVNVVTYEFENVPVDAAEHLARTIGVHPGPQALAVAQDRLVEKEFISNLGIAVAPFVPLRAAGELAAAGQAMAVWGGPAILKTARLGYDGKGQASVAGLGDLESALRQLGGVPCVLERRVDFAAEISVLVIRARSGETRFYDVPRNSHEDGILRCSRVPSGLPVEIERRACGMAGRIAEALSYVGVLGVEMFWLGPGAVDGLLVNEIAPRVHNSGHWTMDACAADQFENHIRAVADWPLASIERHSDVEMVNLIGHEADDWLRLAAEPSVRLHLYGKREARPGRKMGHINRLATKTILSS
jgi:5-(carboxyamino)imidazole ribonucleotide synthase